jgi:hypothetical protein
MALSNKFTLPLEWLTATLSFIRNHFAVIMTLGLIAGLGRVIQLKGFGPVSPTAHLVLEIIIEAARVLLFVYVVGSANISVGFRRIIAGFRDKRGSRHQLSHALRHFKPKWKELLLNLVAYLTIAWLINLFIDHLAYETCLYLTMKQNGLLSETSSEWTIILFFKNLTVIPLTLVLNATFLFFATGRLRALGQETPRGS